MGREHGQGLQDISIPSSITSSYALVMGQGVRLARPRAVPHQTRSARTADKNHRSTGMRQEMFEITSFPLFRNTRRIWRDGDCYAKLTTTYTSVSGDWLMDSTISLLNAPTYSVSASSRLASTNSSFPPFLLAKVDFQTFPDTLGLRDDNLL